MLFENKKLSECGFNDKKSMGWMKVLEITNGTSYGNMS